MGISIWQLLIILAIVILLFGTKKLKNLGGDLGETIRSFKKAVKDGEQDGAQNAANLENKSTSDSQAGHVIEGEAHKEKDKA